ncbi:MOSC-domain-containing protein [Aaosphaeria arxii CBS 175.79]|uniref:MOSC-domain-containing protein n=1 Tax=Aaosphaeria arxii CBS 175.79 TaxID=1450172 RepID=A0A6A5XH88_9PLEO|nr:MOSC-domain-containing protein [Aaosphaeria arxii CBS 175.79]KAF2012216.1 MOSC-domain-containing protein [Aaosphaeria arxii CBS 175.79]
MAPSWDLEQFFEGTDEFLENSVKYLVRNPLVALAILIIIHLGIYFLLRTQPPSLHKFNDLKISEIYVYPIKSLRGAQVSEAVATKDGFDYDRRFMLLKVNDDGIYQNMQVSRIPEMCRFLTSITLPSEDSKDSGSINVEFTAPGSSKTNSITIPLEPDTTTLPTLEVDLYTSKTQAYKMPSHINAWFTTCFTYPVVLAYLGPHRRSVLFTDLQPTKSFLPPFSPFTKTPQIGFADCAPFLLISSTSVADVSSRLPGALQMDPTKFRPNIILSGAESAWEEDYWSRIDISGTILHTSHNCGRCASLNVDYNTGKYGTGPEGTVLKLLQKDRRIDIGTKYSPVFGRYSFWDEGNGGERRLRVGDTARVTRFNVKPTVFSWKALQKM